MTPNIAPCKLAWLISTISDGILLPLCYLPDTVSTGNNNNLQAGNLYAKSGIHTLQATLTLTRLLKLQTQTSYSFLPFILGI